MRHDLYSVAASCSETRGAEIIPRTWSGTLSMRPRHYAAEYGKQRPRFGVRMGASMRPRHYAAEYARWRTPRPACLRRFNEAAALRRGVRQIRGLPCQHQIACFNEAAALRRGVPRRCALFAHRLPPASMRPRHYAAEYGKQRPRFGVRMGASMRPRHYAAEYLRGPRHQRVALRASMRPRHYAAEYRVGRGCHLAIPASFNEAAALRRGVPIASR